MKSYRLKQQDTYFGNHYVGFLTIPDEYYGIATRNLLWVLGQPDIGTCMLKVDEALNDSSWQNVQGLFYQGDDGGFSLSRYLIKNFYPAAKAVLGTSGNTTLYTSAKIHGTTLNKSGTISYPYSGSCYGINLDGSFLTGQIELGSSSATYYYTKLQIPCLFESQIVDGKINLSSGNYVGDLYLELYYDRGTYSIGAIIHGAKSADLATVNVLNGLTPEEVIPDDDPWNDDDESDDGGGPDSDPYDNYDEDSDSNPVPDLPSLGAVDTGFITLYTPTVSELHNLASYMWGGVFDVTTWKKVMADPMDAILGLSIVPVVVPSAGQQAVTVGNISTGISLTKASSQYVSLDCGAIEFSDDEIKFWKAYLDYTPYSKVSIFLPYIGSQEIDIDTIIHTTVKVIYHIDVLSGACVAFITANGNVIMEFSGQCAVSIPITSKDFTQTLMALSSLVASGVGVIASGGLSAPVTPAMVGGLVGAAASTANNVIANKPTFPKSGNMSGSNGLMGMQIPYLFVNRPRKCVPSNQNSYTGYPSYTTKSLGSLSGFTQVQDIHLDGISCNDAERDEILRLLREGVIL